MYEGLTVGVVVPSYNEEGHVGEVIDTVPGFVDRVYVVDDGSTDGTWDEITRHAAARNEHHDGWFEDLVVPIRHERNRGVGGAIKTGYLRAREEELGVTTVLGGDGQMNPDELARYIDPIVADVADYAKGNRFVRPEDWADMPRFRMVGNVLLSYLTKIASGYWGTMDSQNGYTAISLDALHRTDIEGMYEYYGYCNDLLVRLNVAGVRVADVPRSSRYAYQDGWKSHIKYREYVPRVSRMLFRDFFWRIGQKYLLTDYHPIAVLYLLGAGLVGTSFLGLLASLGRRARDGPAHWLPGIVTGILVFVYATMLDREENRDLEVRFTDGMAVTDDEGAGSTDDDGGAPLAEGAPHDTELGVEDGDTPGTTVSMED